MVPLSKAVPPKSPAHVGANTVHIEQLCRILSDQEETCNQLAACAKEQQDALRQGDGPGFVRASLTQAHLARRLYFLEEERNAAVEALARSLSEDADSVDLVALLARMPESDAERLGDHSQRLQTSAEKASSLQKVNAQMIQTNIKLAAALTRHAVNASGEYYGSQPVAEDLPANRLDKRI